MNILISNVKNGSTIDISSNMPIKQVWTIFEPDKFDLCDPLVHLNNAFLEDRYHDWSDEGDGKLRYYPHSSRIGDIATIVVIV